MTKKKIVLITVPVILIALFSFSLFTSDQRPEDKDQLLTQLVFHGLKAHFSAQTIDDSFSEKAHKKYLEILDPTKRFLIKEDIDALAIYKHEIDDQIASSSIDMLKLGRRLISQRVTEAEAYCNQILENPFDFTLNETYQTDPEKRDFASSKEELKDYWRKSLKLQALVRYRTSLQEQKESKEEKKSPAAIEAEVREQLQKTYANIFDALGRFDEDDRTSEYINAMVGIYDPHTEYFPPEDKENFDISMSGKLEGIGAQLQQMDGVIKVSRIVPGSASWKQKELKEGDVILKVAQGDNEPEDVSDMPLKDAVKLIRGKKGTEVRLTIRSVDGLVKVIPIIRDVVILEENFAKSSVIEDKDRKHKYGYIKLPSFYADFSRSGGRNSAEDVKLELLKLKQEGIQGVVLDLRNNGGGSLADAVEMSGLFIKDGPIVQVKTSVGESKVWEDEDASVVWGGPLVILVNKFSASASEILAAAMQDYGRAVIVGSPTTFGKGTVQQFIDLDYFLRKEYAGYKPLGSLKLTIQKFYRVTGHSTQWKGVEPDIILPDSYSFLDGEKDMDFALPWDEIQQVPYTIWQEALPLKYLVKQSKKRVSKSNAFSLMNENSERLQQLRDQTLQPLNYEVYNARQEHLSEEAKKFEAIRIENDAWVVTPTAPNVKNDAMEEQRESLNEAWKKEVAQDATLTEATHIIDDLMAKSGS